MGEKKIIVYQKKQVLKKCHDFKINFLKTVKEIIKEKIFTHVYFRVFMREYTSRIWVFLALKLHRKSSTIWDKI